MNSRDSYKDSKFLNEQNYNKLYKKYFTNLMFQARDFQLGAYEAEDVVQDAFLKLWLLRDDFNNEYAVKSFLRVSIRNRCINIYNRKKTFNKYKRMAEIKNQSELLENSSYGEYKDRISIDCIYKLFFDFPLRCREVMFLSFKNGLCNKEIAKEMGISINTIKTQKRRAIQKMGV